MSECVFANEDLVHLILQQAELRPSTFVAVSRVCKGWRAACMRDDSLLMKVVAESTFLTKTVLHSTRTRLVTQLVTRKSLVSGL